MKDKKLNKKLTLNKETIAVLDGNNMEDARGGLLRLTLEVWCTTAAVPTFPCVNCPNTEILACN